MTTDRIWSYEDFVKIKYGMTVLEHCIPASDGRCIQCNDTPTRKRVCPVYRISRSEYRKFLNAEKKIHKS